MRILVLYDGKSGHLSQALGAAQLIQERLNAPVFIEQRIAKIRVKLLNGITRRFVCASSTFMQRLVSYSYRWQKPEQKPDLIISFGGNTIALNVALSKLWGCHNLAIGNRYSVKLKHLDAHITMRGSTSNPKVILSPIALCKIKPALCAEKGNELKRSLSGPRYWGMLVGGDGSGYHYQARDWHDLGGAMKVISENHGIKWILTTSRRSGQTAEKILMQYLAPATCGKVFIGSDPEEYSLEAILGASERLFCTEDSLSMVTEAVAMEKPVTSLRPKHVNKKTTHNMAIEYLATCGLIDRVAMEKLHQIDCTLYSVKKSYQAHLDDIFRQLMVMLSELDLEPSATVISTASEASVDHCGPSRCGHALFRRYL